MRKVSHVKTDILFPLQFDPEAYDNPKVCINDSM